MESFATPYSVVFHDGEQEHDKGVVGVHSVLSFKRFQALMSQKTGIPANQLSAVFVCRRTLKDTDKRQKLPINENTNFNIILNQHNPSREKDCHFLVSIKKSKKERKSGTSRKRGNTDLAENADDELDSNSSRGDLSPSDVERPKSSQDPSSVDSSAINSVPAAANPNDQNKCMERTLLRRSEHINNNNWSQQRVEGFNVSKSEDSTTAAAAHQQQQQQQNVNLVDLQFMNHERFNDQCSSRPRNRTSRGGGSPTRSTNNFVARMVTGGQSSNQQLMQLQQAQAHLQAMEFSKLSGSVFRALVQGTSSGADNSSSTAASSRADMKYSSSSSTQKININNPGIIQNCKLCCFWQERNNLAEPPFHWCVNDAITMGFRGASPAGPIGRPTTRRTVIEAAT